MLDHLDVIFSFDFSLPLGLQEGLAWAMNLQPTQVYNWFANYRRRQKSRLLRMEELNNSCPERALASHRNEPQDKGSNTPQTAGLSLPNGFRMWSREVKINFKFPQERKDIAGSEQHYVLMDQVAAGGLCFSGVPQCLAPGCHSRGADTANACATRRHQMKANTCEAAGFSSQILESGQCTPGKPSISMSFHRHLTKLQSQGTQGSFCIWQIGLVLLPFAVIISIVLPAWPAPFRWISCGHQP